MLPLAFLLLILCYPLYKKEIILDWLDPYSDFEKERNDDDDELEDEKEDNGKQKTVSERVKAVQEVAAFVQDQLGRLASTAESVKNVVNYSSPFMTGIAIVILMCGTLLLFALPLRLVMMAWGVRKFTKRLVNPRAKDSNELLNYLARVPDDRTLKK